MLLLVLLSYADTFLSCAKILFLLDHWKWKMTLLRIPKMASQLKEWPEGDGDHNGLP